VWTLYTKTSDHPERLVLYCPVDDSILVRAGQTRYENGRLSELWWCFGYPTAHYYWIRAY